jgi:hypothetical protein
MLYDCRADSKNGRPTIRKINGSTYPAPLITQLSQGDKDVINQMYPSSDATPDIIIHEKDIQPTTNSCELTGELIYAGSPGVTQYGICYKVRNGTTLMYQHPASVDAFGRYMCKLEGLLPNTTYVAQAYARQTQNGQQVHTYSDNTVEFKTKGGRFRLDADVIIKGITTHYSSDVLIENYPTGGKAYLPGFIWKEMNWGYYYYIYAFFYSTTWKELGLEKPSTADETVRIYMFVYNPAYQPMQIGEAGNGRIEAMTYTWVGNSGVGEIGGTFELTRLE